MRNRETGNSLLIALVAVLIVAALGVSGWFVYQHNRPQTSGATGGQPTNQNNNQTSTTTYVTITEWGVKAPYSGSLKLSYVITGTDAAGNSSAKFSSDQLSALSTDCIGRGGIITRWAGSTKYSTDPSDATAPTVAAYFQGKDTTAYSYAHVGAYYYTFRHDQAACGDLTSTTAIQSQTNDAVKALVPTLIEATN